MSFSQLSFGGEAVPARQGRRSVSVKDRLRQILSRYPGARNSYKRLMVEYWIEHEGLAEAFREAADPVEGFRQWFQSPTVTSPKTV